MKACFQIAALTWLVLAWLPAASVEAGDSVPPPIVDSDSPWIWVVPRVVLEAGEDWELSGLFTGLGDLELQLVFLDREGQIEAEGSWELVGGRPADYRLAGLGEVPQGAPLTLVISGLDAGPSWLALSLWRSSPTRSELELDGTWLRSDPSWIPGVRIGP